MLNECNSLVIKWLMQYVLIFIWWLFCDCCYHIIAFIFSWTINNKIYIQSQIIVHCTQYIIRWSALISFVWYFCFNKLPIVGAFYMGSACENCVVSSFFFSLSRFVQTNVIASFIAKTNQMIWFTTKSEKLSITIYNKNNAKMSSFVI